MTEATPFLRKYDITFLCPPTIPGRTSLALRGILLLSLCVFAFRLRLIVLFAYFPGLKPSFRRTLRLKTRWSAWQSRESMQK